MMRMLQRRHVYEVDFKSSMHRGKTKREILNDSSKDW